MFTSVVNVNLMEAAMKMEMTVAQTQDDERVDTWGRTPTLELPVLTQEQAVAEMLRLVSKRSGR
jgi:hypothetical protein